LALIAGLPTHHGKPPPLMSQATESLFAENHEHFFNSIDPEQTLGVGRIFGLDGRESYANCGWSRYAALTV
jgi:hypothetical protein